MEDVDTIDSKTWCLRRHFWCWWQSRGWGWCWRTWGCPVLCTGAGAGHWLMLSQSRPEHWQVSAPWPGWPVSHDVSSQSQSRVTRDWPMTGLDTGDTVTMHGSVQDTQDPRGHQGWSHVTCGDIYISSSSDRITLTIEMIKNLEKGYFLCCYFVILGGQLETQVLTQYLWVCARLSSAELGKYLSVSGWALSWPALSHCQRADRPRLRHWTPAPAANVNTGWYLTLNDGGTDKKR